MNSIKCPYCGKKAKLIDSKEVYRTKSYGWLWYCDCQPGGSYVGCHDGTKTPLGRLANSKLRFLRIDAHNAFDPLWRSGVMTRHQAYMWLAEQMNLNPKQCHIGNFDEIQCKAVIAIGGRITKEKGITCD